MAKFIYNDVELEACGDDLDFMEKYEACLPIIRPLETLQNRTDGMSAVELIKEFNTCIGEFFNKLYGDGTWEKIFNGKKRSITEFVNCFNALKTAITDYSSLENARLSLTNMNKPNRAQKRKKNG